MIDDWGDAFEAGAAVAWAGHLLDRHAEKVTRDGDNGTTEVHVHIHDDPEPVLVNALEGRDLTEEWDMYVGQEPLKAQLKVHIDSAKARGEALPHTLLASGMAGVGKGHPSDTPVLTPSGWRAIGDLVVGDHVIGSDGKPTRVTGVFPRGELPIFRVTMSDGSSVLCDDDHLWQVASPKQRHKGTHSVKSVRELRSQPLRNSSGQRRWSVPMVAPVQHDKVDLLLEPYLLGLLLANGSLDKGIITTNDESVIERAKSLAGPDVNFVEHAPTGTARRWIARGNRKRINPVTEALETLQLRGLKSAKKFVPPEYLVAHLEARLRLFHALMDCDGSVAKDGRHVTYSTTSPQLAIDVRTLVQSFGGSARIKVYDDYEHRVSITLPPSIAPATTDAKLMNRLTSTPRGPTRLIDSIQPSGTAEVVCIQVEATDSLYVTRDYLVTHNTTMARLIAKEMGCDIIMLVPPFHATTMYQAAQQLGDGDILFIDEVHKLADHGPAAAENLLHLLEEKRLYLDDGVIELDDITVIGATTDPDKLPETIIDRFPIKPFFQPYSIRELGLITAQFEGRMNVHLNNQVTLAIAKACRGIPRVARELVIAARDMEISYGRPVTPAELLAFKEVDPDGMTRQHKLYVTSLYRFFRQETKDGHVEYVAGEMSMVTLLRETRQGVRRLERFLIERGLLDRTPRGRRLTRRGIVRAQQWLAGGQQSSGAAGI